MTTQKTSGFNHRLKEEYMDRSFKGGVLLLFLSFILLFTGEEPAQAAKKVSKKACLDCHGKMSQQFKERFVHKPFARKDCEACHLRHGFANRLELKEWDGKLCFPCHKAIEKDLQRANLHSPLKSGRCWSCHDPHASNSEKFLVKSGSELCLKCHAEEKEGKNPNLLLTGKRDEPS